jgi:hypothetical protein
LYPTVRQVTSQAQRGGPGRYLAAKLRPNRTMFCRFYFLADIGTIDHLEIGRILLFFHRLPSTSPLWHQPLGASD